MDSAFTILPMSQSFELEAGKSYTGSISVSNPEDAKSDFYYKVTVSPYSVVGEDYAADLTSMQNYSLITDWIKIDNPTGVLKPNDSVDVNFTITVPEDAPSGGQYAALAVSSDGDSAVQDGAVQNVLSMVSVIFGSVAGETTESGEILNNSVPAISFNNPPAVSVTVNNTGNVHEPAIVTLKVKDVFSGRVIFPHEDEMGNFQENVMPGTTRRVTREIKDLNDLGLYEVTQSVYYLGNISTVTKTMLVCPLWFMVLVSATVFAVIGVIVGKIVKNIKRRRMAQNF